MTIVIEPLPAPPAPDPEVDAFLDALIGPALAAPEATGKTNCDECGHTRKLHSRNGCVEQGCACAVTYMDLCAG